MKKILCICLTLVMVMGLSLSAFAAPGAFVESPSNNKAPELIKGENVSEDCAAWLVITAYADRDKLDAETRAMIEYAYEHIVNTHDLGDLNQKLDELAKKLGIDSKYLQVSDMFDISYHGCDEHDDHREFDIVLKPESLKNFVGLLHYTNNSWHLVEDAKVIGNGEHLHFTEKEFSPFAIVVYNAPEGEGGAPGTGDTSNVMPYVIIMIVSAAAIAVLLIVLLKKKSKKETE